MIICHDAIFLQWTPSLLNQLIPIINSNMQNLDERVFIDMWSSFALIFLVFVTFPRNMAQIVKRYKSTFAWKIFFVIAFVFSELWHIVVEWLHPVTLLNITPDIWMFPVFIFCMVLLTIVSKVDTNFQLSRSFFLLHVIKRSTFFTIA